VFAIRRLDASASSPVLTQCGQQVEPNRVQGMQIDNGLRQAVFVTLGQKVPAEHTPSPDGTADIGRLQESLPHELFGISH